MGESHLTLSISRALSLFLTGKRAEEMALFQSSFLFSIARVGIECEREEEINREWKEEERGEKESSPGYCDSPFLPFRTTAPRNANFPGICTNCFRNSLSLGHCHTRTPTKNLSLSSPHFFSKISSSISDIVIPHSFFFPRHGPFRFMGHTVSPRRSPIFQEFGLCYRIPFLCYLQHLESNKGIFFSLTKHYNISFCVSNQSESEQSENRPGKKILRRPEWFGLTFPHTAPSLTSPDDSTAPLEISLTIPLPYLHNINVNVIPN